MASTPAHTTATAEAAPRAAGRRIGGPLQRAWAVAVGSRLIIFAVAFGAAAVIGAHGLPWSWRFPAGAELFHGSLGHFLNPWATGTASGTSRSPRAVTRTPTAAPRSSRCIPLLLRYVGVLFGGDLVVTGIVISLACYGGAVWLLQRLMRAEFGDSVAARAMVYLSLGPLSFFFQAVYTESLFLLLSLACFVCAREGRWRLAGLTGLLATLTRSTGVLLLVPMAVIYYEQRGWRLRRTDTQIANLLMIPEGLLVWMTYLSLAFGKPLLFAGAQAQWQRGFAAPNYAVARGALAAVQGLRQLLSASSTSSCSGRCRSRRRPTAPPAPTSSTSRSWCWPACCCSTARAACRPPTRSTPWCRWPTRCSSRRSYVPLMCYPRFTLTVFPLYVALALFTVEHARAHRVVLVRHHAGAGAAHRQVRHLQLGGLAEGWPGRAGARRRRLRAPRA